MRMRYAIILCLALLAALPPDAAAGTTYKVRKGDNLSRIAKRFHVPADRIIEANNLESDLLKPGMRLAIPASAAKTKQQPAGDAGRESSPADAAAVEESPKPIASAAPESFLARELKELADSPIVREIKELTEPVAGETGIGGIKEKLVGIARKMLDIPYRFGGSSLLGIDCSGYVQKVFGLLDIVLPRTAREQFRLGKEVCKEELSVGDLVFFRTYAKFPSHVGIYLGENRFIHASSTERKVTIDRLDAPYYLKRFIGAKRLDLNEPGDDI